ncbi:MAG: hypothetical protein WCS03_04800 [Bacteroidota bacterium]
MFSLLKLKYPVILIFSGIMTLSCSPIRIIREFRDPVQHLSFDPSKKIVKVHMKDGCLFILDNLITNNHSDTIMGNGSYYDQHRILIKLNSGNKYFISESQFKVPLSDVALLETNDLKGLKGEALMMALVGVPSSIITGYCLINPKACFGSCPTFYAWNGEDTCLMAEGFSSSILPSFEKEDIDMLYGTKVTGNSIHLRLTNEALETHIIRYADLLAFPRFNNDRIFASQEGKFYRISDIRGTSNCKASEGDISEAVRQMDNKERYCPADQKNLAQREYIEMSFDSIPDGEFGLIVGCRQTLLTTFLFYQSLAYLGNSAGYFASRIESGDKSLEEKVNRVWDLLGGIEVFVGSGDGKWTKVDQIEEMGPIATDVHLVPLPKTGTKNLKIKLRLTKGLWRIDYLALGKMENRIEPAIVHPSIVTALNKSERNSEIQVPDTLHPLVTLPGDVYDLHYVLPVIAGEYEIFLKSKGYYIEWMRETWMTEESLKNAALFFGFPKKFMRMAAADFKKNEPSMENNFWNSRYVKKN